jgi:hypothetical protein
MTIRLQAVLRAERPTPLGAALVSASAARVYDTSDVGMDHVSSVVAAQLARADLRVYACDRAATHREARASETLDDDSLRVLTQIGALGTILPQLQPLAGCDRRGVDSQLTHSSRPQRYTANTRVHYGTYVLSQRELERVRRQRLVQTSNVTLSFAHPSLSLAAVSCRRRVSQ